MRTALTTLLGLRVPLVQAPFGPPELAAAVSNAGALGQISLTWRTEAQARLALRELRTLTSAPFGVNFVLSFDVESRVRLALSEGVPIFSFHWGDPRPYLADIHVNGARVLATVGDVETACRYADAGVDVIVAQGWEAGGHVVGHVALNALLPRVADAVSVPVIAAGGIADGRGLVSALALGAAGAWLGTRFVASQESGFHPEYRRALLDATETDTVHTTLFDGGWPDASHRVLRNSTVRRWQEAGQPASGARPAEGEVLARDEAGAEIRRYDEDSPKLGTNGHVEAMALYARQGVGLIRDSLPAAEIVVRLMAEAHACMGRLGHLAWPGEVRQ